MRKLLYLLPESLHAYLYEARSFILVGISNVVFTYIIYLLVILFAGYAIAYTASFCSGILFSAYCNSRYSFSTVLTARRLAVFSLVCLINYFIGFAVLKFFVEMLRIHEVVAPLLVIGVMVPISFVGTRLALVGSLTKSSETGNLDTMADTGNGLSGPAND
ncbi:MAG: GtrA family protein [Rhodospirillaceae bacterium]|jgi:putative flippase GtrA|nr:GtrA family protein [Rhodospirillaceae bacterium]MBT4703430.1 GtrA family protein [Rhodospirillaceae bacterium]MBT7758852.1 GtrA family protein [Rhodospirillaceae bacterium]